jgi:hypothetical protein
MSTSIMHSPACDPPTERGKSTTTELDRDEGGVVALQVYAMETRFPIPPPRDRLAGLERGMEMELDRFVAEVDRRATAITPTLRGILESSGREGWPQWGINE